MIFMILIFINNNFYQIQSENCSKMNINIKLKIRSLLRRGEKFWCLSYNWSTREIVIHKTQKQFIDEVIDHQKNGMIKRAECYVNQPLVTDRNQSYMVYMISFGDFRKSKMVIGENPLAKGFGVCLFDYVYIFIDDMATAKKRMELRMMQMEKKGELFHKNLMLQIYCKYFQDHQSSTESYQDLSFNLTTFKVERLQNS